MAVLSLEIVAENLNKIKQQFENIDIGKNSKDEAGGGGGPSAIGIGAAVSILDSLLKNTESIQGILQVIGGLLNQLIAPFVPILLGLIKPVFVLLQFFLKKILGVISGQGAVPGELGGVEQGVQLILAALGAIAGALLAKGLLAIAGIVGGLATLGITLSALITAALVPVFFGVGKKIGDALAPVGDFIARAVLAVDDFFGTNFKDAIIDLAFNVVDIFVGLFEQVKSLVTLDFDGFVEGWSKTFFGVLDFLANSLDIGANLVKLIFIGLVKGLKGIFNFILDGIKQAAIGFGNLFIAGLNAIIGLLNKVPGVDIGRVSSIGSQARNLQTNITVNIEGSADEKTVQATVNRLRAEINRRGAF